MIKKPPVLTSKCKQIKHKDQFLVNKVMKRQQKDLLKSNRKNLYLKKPES